MDFPSEWVRCSRWIEDALDYAGGTHTIDDVQAMCSSGLANFWPGAEAAIVTEFHIYPRLKSLHFWLAGGDLGELIEKMRPDIETWGRLNGCTRFSIAGRKGWLRAMAPYGYQPLSHICMKDIADEQGR